MVYSGPKNHTENIEVCENEETLSVYQKLENTHVNASIDLNNKKNLKKIIFQTVSLILT